MSIIINNVGLDPANPVIPALRGYASASRAQTPLESDRVEFSPAARALARGVEESSFRAARLRSIRAEIEAGTFETQARIEGTLSRLFDILA